MMTMADLPVPPDAFRWSRESWGFALRCVPLEKEAQHLFTTRQLRLRGIEHTSEAWSQALASIEANPADLRRVKQVHGRDVRVVRREWARREPDRPPEADAIVSNDPGVALAVQVADCVPILLADGRTGAVAAAHAGWRGTVAGVAAAAVQAMTREFGADPADLRAAFGPSIGPCCYEVGSEVIVSFEAAGATPQQMAAWFVRDDAGVRLDLWAANRDGLIAAGLPPGRIHMSRLCTKTHGHVFDSYRADGPNAGRMAALIRAPAR